MELLSIQSSAGSTSWRHFGSIHKWQTEVCLSFPLWISEWIYLSWKKILPGLKDFLDFPSVRSSSMLTAAKTKKVITEHCYPKTEKINTCSQASERPFCFLSKTCNVPSLKDVPRLVKRDLKIIAFNIVHRKTSEVEDPSVWLSVEIHFISSMKCSWRYVNFHAENLRSSRPEGRFHLYFANIISMNCACSDKIDLRLTYLKTESHRNARLEDELWLMASLFPVFKILQ